MWIEQNLLSICGISLLCLNPYSNGMWIEQWSGSRGSKVLSLNPYSNGMWIEHDYYQPMGRFYKVLILILMECG